DLVGLRPGVGVLRPDRGESPDSVEVYAQSRVTQAVASWPRLLLDRAGHGQRHAGGDPSKRVPRRQAVGTGTLLFPYGCPASQNGTSSSASVVGAGTGAVSSRFLSRFVSASPHSCS